MHHGYSPVEGKVMMPYAKSYMRAYEVSRDLRTQVWQFAAMIIVKGKVDKIWCHKRRLCDSSEKFYEEDGFSSQS